MLFVHRFNGLRVSPFSWEMNFTTGSMLSLTLKNKQVNIALQGGTHDPRNPDVELFPCGFGSEGVG